MTGRIISFSALNVAETFECDDNSDYFEKYVHYDLHFFRTCIIPYPDEITSLLTYWVRHKQDTTELPPELMTSGMNIASTAACSISP